MNNEIKHTMAELRQMQSLSLNSKIAMTKTRIKGWINEYGEDGVFISFSGGKDSTVLMDIIRNDMGIDLHAVFVDVPTQFPELRDFAKSWSNVEVIRPSMSFMEVCDKYGFPIISKEVSLKVDRIQHKPDSAYLKFFDGSQKGKSRYDVSKYRFLLDAPFGISSQCCDRLKKDPLHEYHDKTKMNGITAQMASESFSRAKEWMHNGCNGFNLKYPLSNPMAFWTDQDVLQYIYEKKLPICSVYGDVVMVEEKDKQVYKTTGCKRTGCMLCGFGCHMEKPGQGRFEKLRESHPKMYGLLDVVKSKGYTFREAIEWINEHGDLDIRL